MERVVELERELLESHILELESYMQSKEFNNIPEFHKDRMRQELQNLKGKR